MSTVIIVGSNHFKKKIYQFLLNYELDYHGKKKIYDFYFINEFDSLINNKFISLNEFSNEFFFENSKLSLIINYITLENFKKEIYLIYRFRERYNIPVLLLIDDLDKKYISFDFSVLCKFLKCDLFFVKYNNTILHSLKDKINSIVLNRNICNSSLDCYDEIFILFISKISMALDKGNFFFFQSRFLNAFECDMSSIIFVENYGANFFFIKKIFLTIVGEQLDVYIAKTRYKYINNILNIARNTSSNNLFSNFLDKIFLNRFFGLPIFFLIVYLMFILSINVGGIFKDLIDFFCQSVFIEGSRELLSNYYFSDFIVNIVSNGFFAGLSIILSFIPVLLLMFFFLAFLENSGYIPRATFVIDKLMRLIGLPGKAFVPMIIGFGCNVPAILSTRVFNDRNERILTIIMTPFISCNARLAIYTIFVSVFYGNSGGNVIFLLYLIGVLVAILTGLFVKNFFLSKDTQLIIEFSNYKIPQFSVLFKYSFINLKKFIFKSAKVIIPISIFISLLGSVEKKTNFLYFENLCKNVVVLFKPIGMQKDNWPALVGLTSGLIAKEVIIGTLDALYRSELKYLKGNEISSFFLFKHMFCNVKFSIRSMYDALKNYSNFISNNYIDRDVSKIMYKKFGGPTEAFAYLLFILLYFPCLPVIAAIYKELNIYWTYFSILWCTVVSYSVSVIFYQVINITHHFFYSFICLFVVFLVLFLLFFFLKLYFCKYLF